MQVVEIDHVDAEPLQTLIALAANCLRAGVLELFQVRSPADAALGGEVNVAAAPSADGVREGGVVRVD